MYNTQFPSSIESALIHWTFSLC